MKRAGLLAVELALIAAFMWLRPSIALAGEPPPDAEARRAAMEEHREHMKALSPFSMVAAPLGVEMKAAGSGESERTYRYWRAKGDGAVSAVDLVAHYVTGLQALGWKFRAVTEEGPVAFRTGEYHDAEGGTWHVLVLAAPSLETQGRCIITFHLTQVA